jgi:uncharacterized protein
MATRTDTLDLGALKLSAGEGRQLELGVVIEPLELGGHTYTVTQIADRADAATPPEVLPVRLDISRLTGQGYALQISFKAALHGPCMRCLEPADPEFRVAAREVSQPDAEPEEGEPFDRELMSPYVLEAMLDLGAWARDALVLALPAALLHRSDCLGLCPVCGENLNTAGPEHVHAPEPDPRWAVLSELKLDPEPGAEEASGAAGEEASGAAGEDVSGAAGEVPPGAAGEDSSGAA